MAQHKNIYKDGASTSGQVAAAGASGLFTPNVAADTIISNSKLLIEAVKASVTAFCALFSSLLVLHLLMRIIESALDLGGFLERSIAIFFVFSN